jgi:hypothetical protein
LLKLRHLRIVPDLGVEHQVIRGRKNQVEGSSRCGSGGLRHVHLSFEPTPFAPASLPEEDIFLVPSDMANVVAARVEVRKLSQVEAVLKASGVRTKKDSSWGAEVVWVPPADGHGIGIEFTEPGSTERAGTPSHSRKPAPVALTVGH